MQANRNLSRSPRCPYRPESLAETKLQTWFERDRAWVSLQTLADETIVEWWDSAVSEAIDDGFLDARHFHETAYAYAAMLGLVGAA